MSIQFFGQNLHFALLIFVALVCFATAWLYIDAWLYKHERKELLKVLGLLLLSFAFTIHATLIEEPFIGLSFFGGNAEFLSIVFRASGYIMLALGLLLDPLQPIPDSKGLELNESDRGVVSGVNIPDNPAQSTKPQELEKTSEQPQNKASKPTHKLFAPITISSLTFIKFVLPLGAFVIGLLYLRRATTGLERHLKPVAISFFIFTIFEILSLSTFLQQTDNVFVNTIVTPFHIVWFAEHLTLLLGALILGRWVWNYLITRLQTQMFIILTSSIVTIFLLSTISFTFLLMRNISNDSLSNLETATSVLQFALVSKQNETNAIAETFSQNSEIRDATKLEDHARLAEASKNILESKKLSSFIVVSGTGQVLLRAEDSDRWGDSLSDDPLVQRASIGTTSSSFVPLPGVTAPTVHIKSAAPIRDVDKTILGTLIVGLVLDNAFADGIKNATGLDVAVYGGNTRSATTFIAADGKSRLTGIKEENSDIKQKVLKDGKVFTGALHVLNVPFLGVYAPIKDVDNEVVGMLFIGKPQLSLLQTAGHSIQITFLVAVVLLLLSVFPAYYIARYISNQLQ